MDQDICSRALLVRCSISTWTARRFDRKESDGVTSRNGAASDAARVNKHLLGGKLAAASHATAIAACNALRGEHYAQTLPWTDEGWRLLPSDNWMHYTEAIQKARNTYDRCVVAFLKDYPSLQMGAKDRLGNMYSEDDYPDIEDIKGRWTASIEYAPIPASGDIRVELPAAQLAAVASSIEERVSNAVAQAQQAAWERLGEVVAKLQERLSSPDAIFRDTLIENVGETCDVLARLNVMKDPNLEAMRLQIKKDLASLNPDLLRNVPQARHAASNKANELLAKLAGYAGGGR